jgi:hypothetical protein
MGTERKGGSGSRALPVQNLHLKSEKGACDTADGEYDTAGGACDVCDVWQPHTTQPLLHVAHVTGAVSGVTLAVSVVTLAPSGVTLAPSGVTLAVCGIHPSAFGARERTSGTIRTLSARCQT